MDYELKIRTDIIEPRVYLEIELNYKNLLEVIEQCGGYVFYKQIYKWFGNKYKGLREIRKMEEFSIIGSREFNKSKYIYLKSNAIKYLKYRNYPEKVEEPKINSIRVSPGVRTIMNSVYAFEYYLEKKEYINTTISLDNFNLFVSKAQESFLSNRVSNLHLIGMIKDEYVEGIKTKLKILGERNSIFLKEYTPSNRLKDSTLRFIWFDFNQEVAENPVLKILKQISRFLNNIGTTGKNDLINCCNFSLEIITNSNNKKENLESIGHETMISINKSNEYHLNSYMKSKENNVVSNLEEIKFDVLENIEGYLSNTAKDDEFNFVSETVINRFENLREQLKGDD